MLEILERMAAAGINLLPLPDISTHFVFERDGFVSLVARDGDGFGATGSAGLLVPQGFAALVWRGGSPFFVGRGVDLAATPDQVASLRAFVRDLESALGR